RRRIIKAAPRQLCASGLELIFHDAAIANYCRRFRSDLGYGVGRRRAIDYIEMISSVEPREPRFARSPASASLCPQSTVRFPLESLLRLRRCVRTPPTTGTRPTWCRLTARSPGLGRPCAASFLVGGFLPSLPPGSRPSPVRAPRAVTPCTQPLPG